MVCKRIQSLIYLRDVVVVKWSAFYSNDPSSNPVDVYSFFGKIWIEKNESEV